MKYLFAFKKMFLFSLALSGFFIHVAFFRLVKRQKGKQRVIKRYCQLALKSLNIRVTFRGDPPDKMDNFLVVCNHLSYLDILILYSFMEEHCFIVAKDILKTKFLGSIPGYAEAYGVERRQWSNLKEDISAIKNILLKGRNVILFPEGTTGDGSVLQKFKPPIFKAAILAEKKVLPLCINYLSMDGKSLNKASKDIIFWRGGHPIVKHFFRFCQSQKVDCEIVFTSPLPSSHTNRSDLSLKAYHQITNAFKPLVN